jgi:NADH:ubiquinone oxidoreductase subunit F (NADH-binding)
MITTTMRGLLDVAHPGLPTHLATHGALPDVDAPLLAELAGLTGRGGAGFPTAVKLRSVAAAVARTGRAAVVVGNGAEGEPAAAKDRVLLATAPHLVFDGLSIVARTLGATSVFLAADVALLPALAAHLRERRDGATVSLHAAARVFLAGEESAMVAALDGGGALPRGKYPPVREKGVHGRPTLVLNVETLARLALLARGDHTAAARTLVTRWAERGGIPAVDVVEVPLGVPLRSVLALDAGTPAVLVGGYHGTWLPAGLARDVRVDRDSLAAVGASLGAGVLAALPADRCGLRETARVVGYLARGSAGQCGPCLNGLPRIAAALDLLTRPAPPPDGLLGDLRRWCGLVAGRGACAHPDGTVRLVASALTVFAAEIEAHRRGACTAASARPFLPVPGDAR